MTTEQYLMVAISTLAAALGYLWKKVDAAARKCEDDRDNLWRALIARHGEELPDQIRAMAPRSSTNPNSKPE
jgi:hypothetical protein